MLSSIKLAGTVAIAITVMTAANNTANARPAIYQHCNFGGYGIALDEGRYNLGQLQRMGMHNDDISSIRVPKGYAVTLYEHAGFRGRSITRTGRDDCFVNEGFNDIVSSIIVRYQRPQPVDSGPVKIYQHCNYGGYRVGLDIGQYDLGQLQRMGMRNDDISSIQVPHGYEVVLFEHAGFRGRSITRSGTDDCFVNGGFNDIVSSIIVRRQRLRPPVENNPNSQMAPAPQGFTRIQNRWKPQQYLHIEYGSIQTGEIQPGWWSAHWEIVWVPGGQFVRFRNRWKPDQHLHIEYGSLQSGPIQPGWWSAMWIVEYVQGSPYVRLQNRWKPDQYLHIEYGSIQSGPIQPGWWSAMWLIP